MNTSQKSENLAAQLRKVRFIRLSQLGIISSLALLSGQSVFAQTEDFPEIAVPEATAPSVTVLPEEPEPVAPAFIAPAERPAAPIPEPAFSPPIVAPPTAAEIIRPTTIVPDSIPTLPEDYNSVFVDPTDYSIGATTVENTPKNAPEVIVTERSSGCQFSVGAGRSLPNSVCAPAGESAVAAQKPAARDQPVAQQFSDRQSSNQSVNIGPISISSAGVRISDNTAAQNRAYYNKAVRPVVNLQLGQKFIFPLSIPAPITSLFGWRLHPIFGDQRFHAGTDIGAPEGTPVLAAQAGRVVTSGDMGGYGLTVTLRHGKNEHLESLYPHLSQLLVEPNEQVKQGDVIGLVGSTGNSTGPHLHFELRQLTAGGWVTVNGDTLVRQSLAIMVQTLNNPLQALSTTLEASASSDASRIASASSDEASQTVESLSLRSVLRSVFRPAQPNAN